MDGPRDGRGNHAANAATRDEPQNRRDRPEAHGAREGLDAGGRDGKSKEVRRGSRRGEGGVSDSRHRRGDGLDRRNQRAGEDSRTGLDDELGDGAGQPEHGHDIDQQLQLDAQRYLNLEEADEEMQDANGHGSDSGGAVSEDTCVDPKRLELRPREAKDRREGK
ncbi:hypothetical protein FRC07_009274 [Ceratobasidium sp. 392]|nr:hypothetical protein FRC07_009274 [Ceratobasidium sp. 392]